MLGVQTSYAKRSVTSSSNEFKSDPKMLSNMTKSLQTNEIKDVAVMFEATLDCYQHDSKRDEQKQKHLRSLEKLFKDVSDNVI